jgi:hypothetical protein
MISDEVPWPARMGAQCWFHELTDESAEPSRRRRARGRGTDGVVARIPAGPDEPARLLIFPRPRRPTDGYGARHGLE